MATLAYLDNYIRRFWKDPTFWSLAAINIYFGYLAIKMGLNNYTLIWLYLSQSAIIGVFNFLRILTLSKFSTKNFRAANSPADAPPTPSTRIFTALFFLGHYGFFHLVYFLFLYTRSENIDWIFVKEGSQLFFINYSATFVFQKLWDNRHVPNIGEMMFFPYLRIIPIHLSIIFGGFFAGAGMVIFIVLKILTDLCGHVLDIVLREKTYDEEKQQWVRKVNKSQ